MPYVKIFRYTTQPDPGHSPDNQTAKELLVKWLYLTAAVLVSAFLLDGIRADGFFSAIFAAAALGVLNLFFRPVLFILTLPINMITLGLFTLVINAAMLKLASGIVPGFHVTGFWTAVFGSLLISITNAILHRLIPLNRPGPHHSYIDLTKKDDRWQ